MIWHIFAIISIYYYYFFFISSIVENFTKGTSMETDTFIFIFDSFSLQSPAALGIL